MKIDFNLIYFLKHTSLSNTHTRTPKTLSVFTTQPHHRTNHV